jgi:hypothetical protein
MRWERGVGPSGGGAPRPLWSKGGLCGLAGQGFRRAKVGGSGGSVRRGLAHAGECKLLGTGGRSELN